jgi:competence protein ComEA
VEQVPEDVVVRPAPAQPVVDRVRAWLGWFGVARLVVSAVSMVVVCVGAFWLTRSPSPPAEAVLPRVSSADGPASTLVTPAVAANDPADVVATGEVLVHVAGAVLRPGVYQLPNGERVDDAVRAAGGPTAAADLDVLNLAALVTDGARVYVPIEGEVPPALPPAGSDAIAAAPAGPVDINRADAGLLDTLPGVGPATAAAIVAERDRNGPFLGVGDLERVPGIGPAKLAGLRDLVTA